MFAITKIEGNNRSILGKYETLQKAREEGERIYREFAGCMSVSLIEADFGGNDQIIGQKYKLYHMWEKTEQPDTTALSATGG